MKQFMIITAAIIIGFVVSHQVNEEIDNAKAYKAYLELQEKEKKIKAYSDTLTAFVDTSSKLDTNLFK